MGPTASIENATLCGHHACRGRGMQVKLRFFRFPRNPLRGSCASMARSAGKVAFSRVRAQSFAEIVRASKSAFGSLQRGTSLSRLRNDQSETF